MNVDRMAGSLENGQWIRKSNKFYISTLSIPTYKYYLLSAYKRDAKATYNDVSVT